MPNSKEKKFASAQIAAEVDLSAPTVQHALQGALDAWNELAREFVSKKGVVDWQIVNEGLFAAERLNNQLRASLSALGLPVTESRSK